MVAFQRVYRDSIQAALSAWLPQTRIGTWELQTGAGRSGRVMQFLLRGLAWFGSAAAMRTKRILSHTPCAAGGGGPEVLALEPNTHQHPACSSPTHLGVVGRRPLARRVRARVVVGGVT
eukprot:gene23453-biopygen10343